MSDIDREDLSTDDEEEFYETVEDAMESDDFGFVVGSDGEVKAMFMPEQFGTLPDKIKSIMEVLGIDLLSMAQTPSSMIH